MPFWQTTICRSFTAAGTGIHTGCETRLTVLPASSGHGVQFKIGEVRIPARADFVVNTRRSTRLGMDGVQISTVEHLLSALFGLGVDNVLVEVDGPEVPILDGSALPWVEQILDAGIQELNEQAEYAAVSSPEYVDMDGRSCYAAMPANQLSIYCVSEFDHPDLGLQGVLWNGTADSFVRDIAPARTFGFRHEVDALIASGLALGGSLDNALIVEEHGFSTSLRLPKECASHKLLDMIGDLALIGRRLQASVAAVKPSHQGNVQLAAALRADR